MADFGAPAWRKWILTDAHFGDLKLDVPKQMLWGIPLVGGPLDGVSQLVDRQPMLGDVIECDGADYKIGADGRASYVDYWRKDHAFIPGTC